MTDQATDPSSEKSQRLEHFPVAFFASVMGLSGLTLALHAAGYHQASGISLQLTLGVFAALVAVYAAKAVLYPKAVLAEWQHPVKLAFFPAMSISLLLIATALAPSRPDLARIVWGVGAGAQAILTLAVLANWIGHRSFQQMHVSPAWFIPAVGNIVAPVAGVSLGFPETSWLFFSAGLVFWIVLLVLVMNRLIFHDPMPGKLMPTVAILIAPPAVGFLAWLQLNGGEIDAFGRILYNSGLVFLGLSLTQAHRLIRLPFALSWWALSFPLAALAIATQRFAQLTGSDGHGLLGSVLLVILILTVAYLIVLTGRAGARREICRPE